METSDLSGEDTHDTLRLRLIVLAPCAWLVLGMIVPDFLLRVFRLEIPFVSDLADAIGILLVGGTTAYLLLRIRKERFLVRIALVSIGFLLLSVSIRVALPFLPHVSEFTLRLLQSCDGGFSGLGFAAMLYAFFHAIVDLLHARSRIEAEQALLSREMARREQIELALRENERRYRSVVEDQTEIICRFKLDGTLLFVNDVFCRFFGKSQGDLIGTHWRPFVVPEDAALIENRLQAISPANPVVMVEIRVHSGDDAMHWMQLVNRGFFDAKGQLVEIQSVGRDITERQQAETALREREHLLRFMIETIDDVFWQMTPELRFTYVSPAVTRQQGYLPGEVIGRSLPELLTPASTDELRKRLAARPQTPHQEIDPSLVLYEFQIRRKDGTLMWCEAIPSRVTDSDGATIGYQGVTRDITRRRRAEEALRVSEAKYRELVENANSIILRMDGEGRITFFNEFAQRFFGFTQDEIVGHRAVDAIFPGRSQDGGDSDGASPGDPTGYVSGEQENVLRNGERVWVAWTAKPIFDSTGHLQEVLCVGNDVTSRVRAENLLAEERVRLAENARLVSLGIMAGGIAHEINNPLAVIAGCAEQLEAYGIMTGSDDLAARLLPVIQRNARRIQETIQGLRSLSRDASHDPFAPARVDTIIRNTVTLCRERFQLNRVLIEIEPVPEVAVECRAPQISQVLLNLFNNAFDAVREAPRRWIKVSVAEEGESVELSVMDSGPGIPADIIDHLFVPFFTTKSEQHGLGLGLSISHAIVQAHHGKLAVDTSSSNTRLVVRLPKRQPTPPGG